MMIQFDLITPKRLVFSQEIYEAILPTPNGQIAVFPNHIPVISLISPGIISLRKNQSDSDINLEHVASSGGFVEITGNHIRLMADTAEKANEIDELRATAARQKALELKEKASDDVSLADATAALERSIVRLKLSKLKRIH